MACAGPGGLPLGHLGRVGHERGHGGEIHAHRQAVAKGPGRVYQAVGPQLHGHLPEDGVARDGKGGAQVEFAKVLEVVVGDLAAPYFDGGRRGVDRFERGDAAVEGAGQGDGLEGGAGGIEGLGGAVEQGRVDAAGGKELRERGVGVAGGRDLGEHCAGGRLEHHDGARAALQRLLGGGLDARVDGEHHVVAHGAHAGQRVDEPVPCGKAVRTGEGAVVGRLDAGGTVTGARVAHGVGCQRSLGIATGVGAVGLAHALGQGHAVACEDAAALDVGLACDGVVVGGHGLDLVGLDYLDEGQVGDEHGKKGGKEAGEHREAAAQGSPAQHTALGGF